MSIKGRKKLVNMCPIWFSYRGGHSISWLYSNTDVAAVVLEADHKTFLLIFCQVMCVQTNVKHIIVALISRELKTKSGGLQSLHPLCKLHILCPGTRGRIVLFDTQEKLVQFTQRKKLCCVSHFQG